MPLKSTNDRYGSVAIAIHWISAAAIVLLLALGLVAAGTADAAVRVTLVRLHAVLGTVVLALPLLRLAWFAFADPRPGRPPAPPRWPPPPARGGHGLLYLAVLVMAVSGIATLALSGAIPALVAGTALPDFSTVSPRLVHGALSRLLLVLLAAHIGAALYHQFVRRDGVLARMGVGRA